MARKADKNTTRQKAFALLSEHPDASRADMLKKIMEEFPTVKLPYAKTLYQHWRKQSKEAGVLQKVFMIRDHKDGQTVDPYVFAKHVPQVADGMATTEAKAVKQYIQELQKRSDKAKKL